MTTKRTDAHRKADKKYHETTRKEKFIKVELPRELHAQIKENAAKLTMTMAQYLLQLIKKEQKKA